MPPIRRHGAEYGRPLVLNRFTLKGRATTAATWSQHSGISLLEVMISIGVVGIGLIGVASLIPLAHYKAAQGIRDDRKSMMGRRAFREFRIRDLDRPGDMSNPSDAPNPFWYWPSPGNPYAIYNLAGDGKLVRQAYCLDPMMIGFADLAGTSSSVAAFPLNAPIAIPRVTLISARPGDLRRQGPPGAINNQLLNNPPIMSLAQAEEMFLLRDELVFDQPDDATQPPFQRYLENNKRYATGSYSWMATLVPDPIPTSDRYTLSIVVYYRRNLTITPPQETIAAVNIPMNQNGFRELTGVKTVAVESQQHAPPEAATVRDMKTGEWVALMQQVDPNYSNTITLRWYRILAADEVDNDLDNNRELSLSGPDWSVTSNQPIYAVYARNIIAVYEKSIRLQDNNLYAY